MPGIKIFSAITIISEIGVDVSVFPTSKHLCSWAGLTPQNNESDGNKKTTRFSRAMLTFIVRLTNHPYNESLLLMKLSPFYSDKTILWLNQRLTLAQIFFWPFNNGLFVVPFHSVYISLALFFVSTSSPPAMYYSIAISYCQYTFWLFHIFI